MYHQFNIHNSTFFPHNVFMYFVWIWVQTAIISLYSINGLVFITETECVYCDGTDWIFIYNSLYPLKPSGHYMYRQFNIHSSTFFPHSVFMCFVWIWEQTAIISLYNINWLVFITETESVYCAVRTGYLYIIKVNLFCLKDSRHVNFAVGLISFSGEQIAKSVDWYWCVVGVQELYRIAIDLWLFLVTAVKRNEIWRL